MTSRSKPDWDTEDECGIGPFKLRNSVLKAACRWHDQQFLQGGTLDREIEVTDDFWLHMSNIIKQRGRWYHWPLAVGFQATVTVFGRWWWRKKNRLSPDGKADAENP